MISVSCSCGRKFKAEDRYAGKRTKCPVCGSILTVGQPAAVNTSAVKDNGEVPSWWFPSNHGGVTETRTPPPTRSGSDPEAMPTAIIPSAKLGQPFPAGGGQQQGAQPATRTSQSHDGLTSSSKLLLGLTGGALALAGLALGLFLWTQSSSDTAAPQTPVPPHASTPGPGEAEAGPVAPSARPSSPTRQAEAAGAASAKTPAGAVAATVPKLQLLVPAYFFPTGDGLKAWQRLMEAASKVNVVAIANPGDGPGADVAADYAMVIDKASDKGVKVVGYIPTSYGKRPLTEVKTDIDRWLQFYPTVRGFFFDQQSASAQDVDYYLKIRDYARQRIRNALVITNPGTLCDEAYFQKDVSDVTCIFANHEGFDPFNPPVLFKKYSHNRFAAFPYNIRDAKSMREAVKDAILKQIGYLYVSDAPQGANPWGQLPGYWDEEVEAVGTFN